MFQTFGHLNFIKNLKPCLPAGRFKIKNSAGITLIEIIIALAVILTAGIALLQLASIQTRAGTLAAQETSAYFLADEALEATRAVRDQGWSNLNGLQNGILYYPVIQNNTWALSSSNPGSINGYSRSVTLYQVFRDGNGNIAASGSPDANTRRIKTQLSWAPEGGGTQTISLETYLTNWQKK